MNRNLTLALAGLAIVALGVSCDDESTTDNSSTSTSTSSSSGDTGGGGGEGGTGGSTSSSSTTSSSSSSSGSIPPCGSTVQSGDVCPQLGAHCTQTAGCCQCLELVGCNADPIWACLEPANDPGCTTEVPVHGETCGTEGLICEYCLTTGVEIWRCHNLTWVAQMPGCGD
ncbi:MAG: hypothetical protein JRI68_25415 [Deltaproteobacteria bacterium]|nr:hypothetical protein [Deltaproteobacteria bacterium]